MPPGGRIALALEEGPARGSIVVAGGGIETRLVGTFTGEFVSDGQVQVIEWSPTGDALLVWAGAEHLIEGDRNCGNLWTVSSDGSSVVPLTGNGPGAVASLSGYAPNGEAVAYLQDDAVHVASPGGDDQSVPFGGCRPNGPSALRWAPDGGRILLVCEDAIVVVDPIAETATRINVPVVAFDARWTADARSIIAAVSQDRGLTKGPVSILEINPGDGRPERGSRATNRACG